MASQLADVDAGIITAEETSLKRLFQRASRLLLFSTCGRSHPYWTQGLCKGALHTHSVASEGASSPFSPLVPAFACQSSFFQETLQGLETRVKSVAMLLSPFYPGYQSSR